MHHPRHDQAAEYRRQAQEIRAIVQTLSIDEAREQLLETAERLETLAEEEERRTETNNPHAKPQPEA
jgi:GTP cyclohydrolase I